MSGYVPICVSNFRQIHLVAKIAKCQKALVIFQILTNSYCEQICLKFETQIEIDLLVYCTKWCRSEMLSFSKRSTSKYGSEPIHGHFFPTSEYQYGCGLKELYLFGRAMRTAVSSILAYSNCTTYFLSENCY